MTQELYALGSDRSAHFATAFLDRFVPQRKSCSDDYPVPESAEEPQVVLESDLEILVYLEAHPNEPYGLYWKDLVSKGYEQAMLFYTNDGMVIFGLACEDTNADKRMEELRSFVGAEWSMKGWEQRPPENSMDFIALCRQARRRPSYE